MTELEQRAVLVMTEPDGIKTNLAYDRATIKNFSYRRFDSKLRPQGAYRLWQFIWKYRKQIHDEELIVQAAKSIGMQYRPKATQEA